jgi:hypothetical protein
MISFHEFNHPDYSITYPDNAVGHHPPIICAPLDTLLHHPGEIRESNDTVKASTSYDGWFMSVRSLDEIRVATEDDLELYKAVFKRSALCRELDYAEEQRAMVQRCVHGKFEVVAKLEAQIKALDKECAAIAKRIAGTKKTKKH